VPTTQADPDSAQAKDQAENKKINFFLYSLPPVLINMEVQTREAQMANTYYMYYTPGNDYERLAVKNAARYQEWGVDVRLVKIVNTGDWMTNCMSRSIDLHCLSTQTKGNIGLLDADAEPIKEPVLLKTLDDYDLCARYVPENDKSGRINVGVLLFGGDKGREILKQWSIKCREDWCKGIKVREQYYIADSVEEMGGVDAIKFFNLPPEYNVNKDDHAGSSSTVILHLMASRRMRRRIGGSL
jgi:hypothetical protein